MMCLSAISRLRNVVIMVKTVDIRGVRHKSRFVSPPWAVSPRATAGRRTMMGSFGGMVYSPMTWTLATIELGGARVVRTRRGKKRDNPGKNYRSCRGDTGY